MKNKIGDLNLRTPLVVKISIFNVTYLGGKGAATGVRSKSDPFYVT